MATSKQVQTHVHGHCVVPSVTRIGWGICAVNQQLGIEAWVLAEGVILESYRYAPGPASESGKHSYEDCQFCLSLDFPGSTATGASPLHRRPYN